jgi:CCR4-NOT complex subunit CAF16
MKHSPAIEVSHLDFRYGPGLPLALTDVCLRVAPTERCLLVGANGAGKTTLLRVIAGKHMIPDDAVTVLGRPAFHDTSLAAEVAFWGGAFPFEVDVRVGDMLQQRQVDRQRCQRLVHILDVDPDWHMHHISDGQRRRVQLLLGLMHPYGVLLLDEVTTDLDLLGRADLLAFLKEESETRGAAVLYATHILDRLEAWATHIVLLEAGKNHPKQRIEDLTELDELRRQGLSSPLTQLVERWLRSGSEDGSSLDPGQ